MEVVNTIKAFGCHDVVLLNDELTFRHMGYLDLLKVSGTGSLKVDAVAEFQARPMLYIVSGDQAQNFDRNKVLDLQCLLANRGERAYLGVLSSGDLDVYPINLDRFVLADGAKKTIEQKSSSARLFFQNIVNGAFTIKGQLDNSDYVFKTIYNLMTRSSKHLIGTYNLDPLDVLSFLGRALFFRFLWDREIVQSCELNSVCPEAESIGDCFCNIENSAETYRWIDKIFNKDMLPLSGNYEAVFEQAEERTGGKIFLHLQAILEGWEHAGKEAFQAQIDWDDLDFAHIPVGVIGQVYENFSKVWDLHKTNQTSVYYTPENIAGYLVAEAFEGVSSKKDAKILDPSCGAGIFLVLAFRKLVAARWEHDGKRPDTRTIQSILYNQLCGFDISESALRLAELSLYITAIELDEHPHSRKLSFSKPLQGIVLHNHRRSEDKAEQNFVQGSLRSDLSEDFNGNFDIVISDPPWSRLKGNKEENRVLNAVFTKLARQILTDRGLEDVAKNYHNPDNNPNLPFLWKSIQWAKPGGIIAMALPGRIFLKQTGPSIRAFNAVLQSLEITEILNGINLSDSAVWPDTNQPFMLFFARNNMPSSSHHFHFVTPHFEQQLNNKGRIRIDYQSAQPIAANEAVKNSQLLKTLTMGTSLDVDLLDKLDELGWPTVKSYWKSQKLYSGKGYDLSFDHADQKDASLMLGFPDFVASEDHSFSVDISLLPRFGHLSAHRPRDIQLYKPPLLIVPESPGTSLFSPKSWTVRQLTVFHKNYYGFSAHGSNDADLIIALLHLLTHSDLFGYHVLMNRSIIGAERKTFLKGNIEKFPFPPVDILSRRQRERILKLSDQLETSFSKPWKAIDDFIFDIYGLDEHDRQVVNDTLEAASSFEETGDSTDIVPSKNDRKAFYVILKQLLNQSFNHTDEILSIDEFEFSGQDILSPWYFFAVSSSSTSSPGLTQAAQKALFAQIAGDAGKTGCSRAIVHEKGRLLVGIIGQYRYWTDSRARLCALDILRNHLDAFSIRRN